MIANFLEQTKGNWTEVASDLSAFSKQDAQDSFN
jgi:hypothetical protein